MYEKDKKKLEKIASKKDLEAKLNQLVYDLYELNDERDIEVVTNFLFKF